MASDPIAPFSTWVAQHARGTLDDEITAKRGRHPRLRGRRPPGLGRGRGVDHRAHQATGVSAFDALLDETRSMGPAPTDEQAAIVDAFATGEPLVVEAGAGTGKTTTLQLLGDSTVRRGRYLAFNRSIANEAGKRFGPNVAVSTVHSMAWHAVVRNDEDRKARLNGPRVKSWEIAKALRIEPVSLRLPIGHKWLEPWRVAGLVLRAVEMYCQSADDEPGPQHVARLEGCDRRAHRDLVDHVLPYVREAWADLLRPHGALQFRHGHYLKIFALAHPQLGLDFILFDEAQDASALMVGLCDEQTDTQVVMVGDANQAIYGWAGATDAMTDRPGIHRRLTQSWRFGDAVAQAANGVLEAIGTDMRLTGNPGRSSAVRRVADGDVRAILCRTNARAVEEVIDAVDDGRRPHLVGNGEDVLRFAYGVGDLQEGRKSSHPDLMCFDTWDEVQTYAADDAMGHELRLLVDLVRRFTVKGLIRVLQHELWPADRAGVVISTAHKAKGLEWDTVRLASDLTAEPDELTGALDLDELRLLYVAATRARSVLDPGEVPLTFDGDLAVTDGRRTVLDELEEADDGD